MHLILWQKLQILDNHDAGYIQRHGIRQRPVI